MCIFNNDSTTVFALFHFILYKFSGDYQFCIQNANFQQNRIMVNINGMNTIKYMEQLKIATELEKLEDGISV